MPRNNVVKLYNIKNENDIKSKELEKTVYLKGNDNWG